MSTYIMPIEQVFLEYILKLGKTVFFPGTIMLEMIEESKLDENEKELLNNILIKNQRLFDNSGSLAFILFTSDITPDDLTSDISNVDKVFSFADRALDFVRIRECPFKRPEYLIGMAGLLEGKRYLLAVESDYTIRIVFQGKDYFYSMQKGIGLDVGSREDDAPDLYNILFSSRTDEVYNKYRQLITDACTALKINDESRCFVYLFSKVDGMGLCDSFHFQENKKRVLSLISKNQREFDIRSNNLYFYSKMIRTEIVHKGGKVTDFMSIEDAHKMSQELFNTIIDFSCAAINTPYRTLDEFKNYLSSIVGRYIYNSPQEANNNEMIPLVRNMTTYAVAVEGLNISTPEKRGSFLLLPSIKDFSYDNYTRNHVTKDLGGEFEEIFSSFTMEDMEYAIEYLARMDDRKYNSAIIVGLNMPKIFAEEIASPIKRDYFVDYICNEFNYVLYYDMLGYGEIVNDYLPPRIGINDGIRSVFELIEEEGLYLLEINGRVYNQYSIPELRYRVVMSEVDDIYKLLFEPSDYVKSVYREVLANVCESQYFEDLSQRICFLYDIFDSLDPRGIDDKPIKYTFTFLASDRLDYNQKKTEFENKRTKYRNPILHGGRTIYELVDNETDIINLIWYLERIIVDYTREICSLDIRSWEELDEKYRNNQRRLGLIR
ncbi:MAG: hypothetical protein K6E79_00495 [Pseudobutyrivibrio sp.]|nr:hypothetical protein [Pseudobutyrivibrio sp.]